MKTNPEASAEGISLSLNQAPRMKNIKLNFEVEGTTAKVYLSSNIYNHFKIDECDYDDKRAVTQAHQCIAKVANTLDVGLNEVEVLIDKPNNYTVDKLVEMAFIIRPYAGTYSW